jgi:hypothetical protein
MLNRRLCSSVCKASVRMASMTVRRFGAPLEPGPGRAAQLPRRVQQQLFLGAEVRSMSRGSIFLSVDGALGRSEAVHATLLGVAESRGVCR